MDLDSGATGRGSGGVLEDGWPLLRGPGDRTLCVSCMTSLLGLSWRVPESTVAPRNPESVRSTRPRHQAGKPAGASPAPGLLDELGALSGGGGIGLLRLPTGSWPLAQWALGRWGSCPCSRGLQGCVLPPTCSSCSCCSSCEASRGFEVPPPDQLHWSL